MDGLAGTAELFGSEILDTFVNIDVGKQSLGGVLSNLTLLSIILNTFREHVVKESPHFYDEYDYIIIGGGTAGSVLASRLSQHHCVNVLLLEAGGEQPVLTDVPGFSRAFLGTEIDWSYFTAPQKYSSFGQRENKVYWNSGKVLGGSSVINAMLYVRGNKENFNEWARQGCTGWSYEEVLPYFKKLEDNYNMNEMKEEDKSYHNVGGPMGCQKMNFHSPIQIHSKAALKAMGYPETDSNGRQQFGVYEFQSTFRNQERCSTARAYLKPASGRGNLHILTNAFVRKILITKRGGYRAFAVVFEYKNKVRIVRIRSNSAIDGGHGEIIVANGATRTPQTLILSGIGPKEHLQELGIPVIADLPVGKNLMDHYAAGLLYTVDPLLKQGLFEQISPDDVAQYVFERKGPLCSSSQVSLLAFTDGYNNTNPYRDFPMQEIYINDYATEDALRTLNLKQEILDKVFTPYLLSPVMFCYAQLLQPYGRGEITVTSIDPHEFPHINPNYFMDPRDVQNVVEAMKICNAIARHPEMQKIKTKWVEHQRTDYPGCESFNGNEDEYLACIARSYTITIWHPTGTARMGHPDDPRSVVDPELKVIGVNNLRVVNAAIMPIITSGNTNVPTMMIAEKAYDMMQRRISCPATFDIHGAHQVRVH